MLVCDEGSCEDWVRRYSLILFHQCVSQPEKWVGKHTLFLWGCVALSKVHFIYKSKSGHCISPQHRHGVLTHAQTPTIALQHVLAYSQIHKETQRALPLCSEPHTSAHVPSVSIWTVHAMSRDQASCTVNVSAVQMINVSQFTFPSVAQIPLSSRLIFCAELTPGLQVKIAALACFSLPSHHVLVPPLGYQTWENLIL